MTEDLLHYIWKSRLFRQTSLRSTEGEPLTILQPGEHNHDAGPDFFNARIRVGRNLWAGNVELHLKSSDWGKHLHRYDSNYRNLILHVVYEVDQPAHTGCPVLELKPHVDASLLQRYALLMKQPQGIHCREQLRTVRNITRYQCLDRMTVERLQDKCAPITQLLRESNNHFEETFYILLMRSMGQKVNAWAFEQLARLLPLSVLARHKNNLPQVEALLLGTAGLLEHATDTYARELFNEYRFLKHKYSLNQLPPNSLKWMRLRPSAFPEIRLAQAAALIHQSTHLLSKLIACSDLQQARELLQVQAGTYWDTHYHLGEPTASRQPKRLGTTTVDLLLVNAVIPFLFLYAELEGDEPLREKSIRWLEQVPPEKNTVTTQWESAGLKARHAADSQALLKLRQDYCNFTRCTSCLIGQEIVRGKNEHTSTARLV